MNNKKGMDNLQPRASVEKWPITSHTGKEGHAHLYGFKEREESDKVVIYIYRCLFDGCRNEKWYRHKKAKKIKVYSLA